MKEIIFDAHLERDMEFDARITPELKAEGTMRDIVREVQQLRQDGRLSRRDKIELSLAGPLEIRNAIAGSEAFKKSVGAKRVSLLEKKPDSKKAMLAEADTKIDGNSVWVAIKKA